MEDFCPLVICGSARSPSNTQRALTGLMGFDVPLISLCQKTLFPYNYTLKNPRDDFLEILECVLDANPLILATPVYWHAMSAQMKIFFDRMTDVIDPDFQDKRLKLRGKKVLVVASSAKGTPEGFEVPFQSMCHYFSMVYCGCWNWIESEKEAAVLHNQTQKTSFDSLWKSFIS